jgi:hypothetical protein
VDVRLVLKRSKEILLIPLWKAPEVVFGRNGLLDQRMELL